MSIEDFIVAYLFIALGTTILLIADLVPWYTLNVLGFEFIYTSLLLTLKVFWGFHFIAWGSYILYKFRKDN